MSHLKRSAVNILMQMGSEIKYLPFSTKWFIIKLRLNPADNFTGYFTNFEKTRLMRSFRSGQNEMYELKFKEQHKMLVVLFLVTRILVRDILCGDKIMQNPVLKET